MGIACGLGNQFADIFGYTLTACQPEAELEPRPLSLEGMVKIPAGTFEMGSKDGDRNERPVHKVTITHDYYLDDTEVTNKAYTSVTGKSPSPKGFDGPDQPVVNVSWYDADRYCRAIGKRLPTEAEWENAASVGGKYLLGTMSATRVKLAEEACVDRSQTCDVKEYPPNELGLYGMSGNVWEWVNDWSGDYPADHVIDPKGPNDDVGAYKVMRGGSRGFTLFDSLLATNRNGVSPFFSYHNYGFRCASSED